VIHNHKYFDEPIDAMVYMITAAMGFAALENAVFLIAPVGEPFEMMIFRFVGATLLHALASGLLGYYWIKGKVFLGLTVATVLHLFFNILIIAYPQSPFYACGILIFASFFLFYDFDILKAYEREKACR
jgi:RsiW-degrading membrane proteinase PrsW (M82 family)